VSSFGYVYSCLKIKDGNMLSFITTSDILLSHIYAIEKDRILRDEKILMEPLNLIKPFNSSYKQDK